MTIRAKTLCGTSAVVTGLLALMYIIFRIVLIGNFEKLEERQMHKDAARVKDAFAEDIASLDRMVLDYAAWDDTYAFIAEQSPEYIESNLLESGFAEMNINFLIITNASGKILHKGGIDLETNQPVSLPPELLRLFSEESALIRHSGSESCQKGVLSTTEGTFLFSSRPVVTSDGSSPVRGSFAMIRRVDAKIIERISGRTHLSLTVKAHGDADLPGDFQEYNVRRSDKDSVFVKPVSESRVAAYARLQDVFGKPALLLRVEQDRDMYKQGKKMLHYFTLSLLALGILLGLVIFWVTESISGPVKRIISGLSEASDQVSSVAGQISGASQSLSAGASLQAASVTETSSSLEGMSSMIKQNAGHAAQADSMMKQAGLVVQKAKAAMDQLTASMQEIAKASEDTSKIIKTIDEIAFQTNLLALNAAVEAARAGEAGAGFAVVADEVRNLANRAADAAKTTAALIDGAVKRISDGTALVKSTSEAFNEVAGSAAKAGGLVGEISAACNEQAQGIEQVNIAVMEMDNVTRQNSETAEESSSASEELNAQALKMNGFVGQLAAMVGGSATVSLDHFGVKGRS